MSTSQSGILDVFFEMKYPFIEFSFDNCVLEWRKQKLECSVTPRQRHLEYCVNSRVPKNLIRSLCFHSQGGGAQCLHNN